MTGSEQRRYVESNDAPPRHERIAHLNDALRCHNVGGRVLITRGVQTLDLVDLAELRASISDFDAFSEGNDPYGERDFGSLDFRGEKIFWKIDYYDIDLNGLSPDPSIPEVTNRIMTIMLADEY